MDNSPTTKEEFLSIEGSNSKNNESTEINKVLISNSEITNFNNENSDNELSESKRGFCSRYFGPIKEGSLRGSTIAMASITFGSGCLSFPFVVAKVGPIVALVIFTFVAIISYITIQIIVDIGFTKKIFDYNELVEEYLGTKMVFISDILNLLLCFGVIIGYQYTISTFFMETLELFAGISHKNQTVKLFQMLGCMIIIQIPLGLLKDISKLQYASIAASCALIYTILVIAIEMPFYLIEYLKENSITWFVPLGMNLFDTFSVFVYGFSSHNGVLQIYAELHRPTDNRVNKVLNRSIWLEIVLYLTISYAGFFSTFYNTEDIFLKRPDIDGFNDYFIVVAKIALIISLHCVMAINYNIMRMSYRSMFFKGKNPSFVYDFLITIAIFVLSNIVTYFVESAVDVLSIIGGVCTIWICFFNPLLIYLKSNEYSRYHVKNVLAFGLMVFTFVSGCIATGRGISEFVKKIHVDDD